MRILIIEDEHSLAQALKKGLEQENYIVDNAYDGEEGYDLASTEDYDVLILDLMLPKLDGLTLCQQLRHNQIHTPVLMLTAKSGLDDRVNGLNAGADDYLPKPFAFTELLARLRALTRRPKQTLTEKLSYRDLIMDTAEYTVFRGKREINLSKKEFALLEFLLRHPEKIMTKDQIIAHVWSYESDILPNTVEAFIGSLRQKIDRSFTPQPSLIQTVRGFGYQLKSK